MKQLKIDLKNIEDYFPKDFDKDQTAKCKTIFFKELSYQMHKYYNGKIQVLPKAGIYGFNWFNLWYTPGVSKISNKIKENQDNSFELSARSNLVAVVSDSTRVLGDGDVGISGGLGVMEGKAFLMKYLGGVDGFPLCVNNRDENNNPDAKKLINFVKMVEPSFGAINLEDISQPNCYEVLDTLRKEANIPVWHDDAQGTACVTLAGLINALKIAEKRMENVRTVFIGSGAANTTIASICMQYGMKPENIIMFDSVEGLHSNRIDIKNKKGYYKQWDLCKKTNPKKIKTLKDACKGADVIIALSTPGPDIIKPEWIKSMNKKSIIFACANPIPEIYPHTAKEAGAFIVATGRGDFPNQVNNSIGFPGILKGALIVKAKQITDKMTITASESLANYIKKDELSTENIVPNMEDIEIFPNVAADVGTQAIKEGIARVTLSRKEIYNIAKNDILNARNSTQLLMKENLIKQPDLKIIKDTLDLSISIVKGKKK